MKRIISGLLACASLLSLGTVAAADSNTQKYDTKNFAKYNVTAKIMQKQLALDIVIPSKIEAAITKSYLVNTNTGFDINNSDTNNFGNIDSTYMAMCFFSPEYQIVNNSDIPIKMFATMSATVKGKVNLLENLETNVEDDNKKNLRLWLSHSLEEGGSKASKDENGQRIFDAETKGDILITKKAPKTPDVVFEKIGAKDDDDNIGYFRINGQAKEIPNPYWDVADSVSIKVVLKFTPAYDDSEE